MPLKQAPAEKIGKKILILTLSAGSGHFQAAKAKCSELVKKIPKERLLFCDILLDWLTPFVGKYATNAWNKAQKKGAVQTLGLLTNLQTLADWLFWPLFFWRAYRTLKKNQINYIIDTQPLGTSAIIKAIRLIEWETGHRILYEKILTDLPTTESSHFFKPIRSLSAKDRLYLRLVSTHPLLEESETETLFWYKNCKLELKDVTYKFPPLRESFHKYTNRPLTSAKQIFSLNAFNKDLTKKIKAIASYGPTPLTVEKTALHLTIHPEDKVALISLGGNPDKNALLEYAKLFIDSLLSLPPEQKGRKDLLFILCNDTQTDENSFYSLLLQQLEKKKEYPASLTILPLPFQTDKVLAPLLHRANAIITRSGGLTSMELLTVSHGKIWIHKGKASPLFPKFFLKQKAVREGMPSWERGNAEYLQAKKGALFITPETFKEVTSSYFS